MLFQTRSCFVLRLNGAELMFRGDEITSRNTLWVNNEPVFLYRVHLCWISGNS